MKIILFSYKIHSNCIQRCNENKILSLIFFSQNYWTHSSYNDKRTVFHNIVWKWAKWNIFYMNRYRHSLKEIFQFHLFNSVFLCYTYIHIHDVNNMKICARSSFDIKSYCRQNGANLQLFGVGFSIIDWFSSYFMHWCELCVDILLKSHLD